MRTLASPLNLRPFGTAGTQGDILYHNGAKFIQLPAGTDSQLLETQGAGANPQWVSAGRWYQITSGTVSSSSSLDITFTAASWRAVKIILTNFRPVSGASNSLSIRTDSDGGASYDSGASDYEYEIIQSASGVVTSTSSTGASSIVLPLNQTSAGGLCTVEATIMQPASALFTNILISAACDAADGPRTFYGVGWRASNADVDAIRFLYSVNIDSGNYEVLGLLE